MSLTKEQERQEDRVHRVIHDGMKAGTYSPDTGFRASGGAGKGSKRRPCNWDRFRANFDRIQWSR